MSKLSFKQYLKESEDTLTQINTILDTMSEEELDELGWVLFDTFFSDEKDTDEDEFEYFYIEDIKEMVEILGPEFYDVILDFLDDDEDNEDHDDYEENYDVTEGKDIFIRYAGKKMKVKVVKGTKTGAIVKVDDDNFPKIKGKEFEINDEDLVEGVSKRMMAKRFNRKKRKFMKTSAAELRRTKTVRKREARSNRAKRMRYYRANKIKLAAYQKSRSDAIKKGKHKIKMRRKTGSGGE